MTTKNSVGYVVRLSESAFIGMILNGLEAYAVSHDKKHPFVETYGSLFGYQASMQDQRTLYQIEMTNVDTSAVRKATRLSFSLEALSLKSETMHSYWPHLEYLGAFHTHPYANYSAVSKTELESGDQRGDNKGYFFSQADKTCLADLSDYFENTRIRYRVGIALAVTAIRSNNGKKPSHIHSNCIEFNLKRHKMWITAYCAFKNEKSLQYTRNNDPNVYLDCRSASGYLNHFL